MRAFGSQFFAHPWLSPASGTTTHVAAPEWAQVNSETLGGMIAGPAREQWFWPHNRALWAGLSLSGEQSGCVRRRRKKAAVSGTQGGGRTLPFGGSALRPAPRKTGVIIWSTADCLAASRGRSGRSRLQYCTGGKSMAISQWAMWPGERMIRPAPRRHGTVHKKKNHARQPCVSNRPPVRKDAEFSQWAGYSGPATAPEDCTNPVLMTRLDLKF